MSTEVWFRDPANYVKELVEVGVGNIAWNRGGLVKKRLDPVAWAELFYGNAIKWRILCVGPQGTAEVGPGRGLDKPIAVYPTWAYGDEPVFLEEMMAKNIGTDLEACFDTSVPADERPVPNQEHRVVITGLPPVNTGAGRSVMRWLKELQEDHPEVIMHIHGLYSYKMAFGLGFGAADMEPRTSAAKGRIILASGNEMDWEKVQKHGTWVTAMGMSPGELNVPRNRCIFNIRSAMWAGANYRALHNPRTKPSQDVDTTTPDISYTIPSTRRALPVAAKLKDGDKTLCDMCSLQLDCKQYRAGEVCSLTDGNTVRLAQFFKTRNSDVIIDGLGTLMAMQANRLEGAAAEENALGEINPEVTKMVNGLFSQGVQLAKLVDPKLRSAGTKVQVGIINGQATATASTTPSELTGQVVRALEAQGIPRDKITPELVMATIQGMQSPEQAHRAIEGTVIAEEG